PSSPTHPLGLLDLIHLSELEVDLAALDERADRAVVNALAITVVMRLRLPLDDVGVAAGLGAAIELLREEAVGLAEPFSGNLYGLVELRASGWGLRLEHDQD